MAERAQLGSRRYYSFGEPFPHLAFPVLICEHIVHQTPHFLLAKVLQVLPIGPAELIEPPQRAPWEEVAATVAVVVFHDYVFLPPLAHILPATRAPILHHPLKMAFLKTYQLLWFASATTS